MLIHNADITGSLTINGTRFNTGSFSGSFTGTVAGGATTGSNRFNGNQIITGSLTVSGSTTTLAGNTVVTGSFTVTTGSVVELQVTNLGVNIGNITTDNHNITGSLKVSGSLTVTTTGTELQVTNTGVNLGNISTDVHNVTGSLLVSGSTRLNGNTVVTGSLTVTGQVVAQTLNVQQVTSSIVYSSGSNVFGNSISNVQQFTGSISASGSMSITPGITVTGDGSNDMFKAVRSGTTRFVVKNAVNSVGINTDTINNPLTVNGGADFSGNVGIGIASPGYKIEVAGADSQYWNGTAFTGTPLALAISNTTAGGYDPVLILQQADSGGTVKNAGAIGLVGRAAWTAGNNATQISDMYFLVRNSSGGISERMRITSGGEVGIGVTPTSGNRFWIRGSSTSSSDTSLFIQNSTPSALFLVRNDGNVGIANTSPNKKLEITTGNGVHDGIRITYNNVTSEGLDITYLNTGATTTSFDSIYNSDSAVMRFRMKTGGTPVTALSILGSGAATFNSSVTATSFGGAFSITMQGAGNNGISDGPFYRFINTTNSYQLLKQLNASTGEDVWYYNGSWSKVGNLNAVSGVYTALSDVNKKKDFEDSTIGLNAILGLKPTLYRMEDEDESVEKQLGFIAQEVKEYIPQACVEQENFVGLQDRPIIAALVKAIQELKSELDAAKTEIQLLKQQ